MFPDVTDGRLLLGPVPALEGVQVEGGRTHTTDTARNVAKKMANLSHTKEFWMAVHVQI